ncbi:PAS domain-containing hybrid sensor histidine kinase/response regulator [Methyloversatilis universalis]|uniref:PAS domain-containing hybrid sensor histidine kinase/response regulator n=1 Tax=Methyloversatilis universalis TaxID=378211 RepID=UPI000370A020|nr:PAS domain-containing hybrid sensor histidine kinase/response regulator [Methyloversatilis universalis]
MKGRAHTPTSIAALLIVLIVVTVSVLLGAAGALAYRSYSQGERAKFTRALQLATEQLSISLAPAAWNLEYEQVRKLMESRMREPSVHGLTVQLDTARFTLERGRDGEARWADGDIDVQGLSVSELPIRFEDQIIGQVRQFGTERFVDQELRSALITLVLLILLLDAVLSLALYVGLQRMVLQPLRLVERHANDVARGENSETVLGELHFVGELQRLTQSIDAMVRQLGLRNAELSRSTERFERVIRLLPFPISLFDREGRIVFVNDRFVDTFGYTLKDIPDAHTWFQLAYPDPAYRSEVLNGWAQELEASRQTSGLVRARPYRVTCRDGSVKIVEIGGMMTEDPNITVLNDITDRTLAEEELARHRNRLEELVSSRTAELEAANRQLEETQFALDHAGVAIQWIDAETGCFNAVNDQACTLFGRPRERIIGLPASAVLADFSRDGMKTMEQRLRAEGSLRLEGSALRGDGSQVPIEIGVFFDPPPDGSAGHYIVFAIDITPRKEAEQALIRAKLAAESAAQARSEFLANMSHEIRTPMNAVIGMTRLALQTELTPKQRNFVSKANGSAVALLGILNDILDFSKVEAGRIDLEQVDFRLERVFDSLGTVIALRADEKGLDLLFDVAPDTPDVIVGDPLRLGQILTNLAGNAVKFTDRGEVIVSCRPVARDDDGVTLEFGVRDTGIGMSAEQISELFQPFRQGDSTISRRFGGTGLGLAISKRLADLMHATLQVRSVPDQGSHFTLTARFPLGRDAGSTGTPHLPAELNGRKVLVVDDNPDALDILCRDLAHLGLLPERATSAAAALEVIAGRPPFDLLVSDWRMPGMDGIELARQIQSMQGPARPPTVIMVSVHDAEEVRSAGRDLALAGVLSKPVSLSALHDALIAAFGRAPLPSGAPGVAGSFGRSDAAALRGRSVLLVEDNEINQELGIELLRNLGMQVSVADNGREALDQLDRQRFDCVLMDVQMPVMDGLAATLAIRKRPGLEDLPVIAMTAGAMEYERAQTRAAGMNDHVTKPVDVDALIDALLRALSGRPPVDTDTSTAGSPSPDDGALLDPGTALHALRGKESTYLRILGLFLDSADPTLDELRSSRADMNIERLRQLAHRLRGSCGSLGAHALHALSDRLEQACRANETEQAAELAECVATTLSATRDAVRHYLDRHGKPMDPALMQAELSRLRTLLTSNDSDALDVIDSLLAGPVPPQLHGRLKDIARATHRYDFDAALAHLQTLPLPRSDAGT